MKRKMFLLFLIFCTMFSFGFFEVSASSTGWGKEVQIENTNFKFKFEDVSLDIYSYENIISGSKRYIKTTKLETLSLTDDLSINPTIKRGIDKEGNPDRTFYIDLNMDLTKQKLGQILYDEVFGPSKNKYPTGNIIMNVVVNSNVIALPKFTNYYQLNLTNDIIKYYENEYKKNESGYKLKTLDQISLNKTNKIIINSAMYTEEDDYPLYNNTLVEGFDDGRRFLYSTDVGQTSFLEFTYNYIVCTNNNYSLDYIEELFENKDITQRDRKDAIVRIHDLDSMDDYINYRKDLYEDYTGEYNDDDLKEVIEEENDNKDDLSSNTTIEVPNTSINKSTLLIAFSILAIITGLSIFFISSKTKDNIKD